MAIDITNDIIVKRLIGYRINFVNVLRVLTIASAKHQNEDQFFLNYCTQFRPDCIFVVESFVILF